MSEGLHSISRKGIRPRLIGIHRCHDPKAISIGIVGGMGLRSTGRSGPRRNVGFKKKHLSRVGGSIAIFFGGALKVDFLYRKTKKCDAKKPAHRGRPDFPRRTDTRQS